MPSAPPCPSCGFVGHTPVSGDAGAPAVEAGKCPRCGAARSTHPTAMGDENTPPPGDGPPRLASSSDDSGLVDRGKTPAATVLGDYRLVRKLGEGAMGAVYKAKQTSTGQNVALKVLFRHVAKKPRCVERFAREARVMMRLEHPNIVKGYAVGEGNGLHFFAMEYLSGCSLQQWINRHGPMKVGDALHVTLAIARALAYAHGQDLIHRDIKPDNVLLGFPPRSAVPTSAGFPVQVKITDLGMAKVLDDDLDLTQTGYGVGTPCYMPLEQAKNSKDADGRCDIYALGCVLYCALTGHPPFSGATLVDLIQAKEANTFRPARRFNAEVPQRLDLIIYKMIAKLPKDRYQTCAEVIRDLESLKLAHPTLCLPRPESDLARPDPGAGGTGTTGLATRTPERVPRAGALPTRVMAPDETDLWHVRYHSTSGRLVKRTLTTAQVLEWIASEQFDPTTQASRHPETGFRALAVYREFKAAVMPRVTKAGADVRTSRLRSLARQAVGQDDEPAAGPGGGERLDQAAPLSPGGKFSVPTLLFVILGLVGLAVVVVIALKLLDVF